MLSSMRSLERPPAFGKAHAFGIALELAVSRVGLAAQENVKSICAFGKVAATLVVAAFCLDRSLTRRPSRLNADFDRPRAKR